ncbi:MAG: major capsid protein [Angelakisella sp.]|nr:major capsid protein [Angelakisella sp.]
MDIYSTYYMLAAVNELPPEPTFFKRRYFPTNVAMDIFGTSKVLADYKDSKQRRAPFVLPRIGSVSIAREGFSTYELEPGNISISIPLTVDQLKNRGFGEALMNGKTPAERARMLLIGDLKELSARISRTEECLAIQTMIDNGCVMRHQTETPEIYEDIRVQFYDGADNPALFTPTAKWVHSKKNTDGSWVLGNWYHDVCAMIKMLISRGLPARELLMGADLGEFILSDPWVMAVLDNRRMEMGRIDPKELTEYVSNPGVLKFGGRTLDLLVSDGSCEDEETGEDVLYVPDGTAIVTAPDCGRGLYGAVTQLEKDGEFHTYAGTRVPQHIFTLRPPAKETQITSRPLFAPKRKAPWSVAKNVFLV